MVGFWLRIGLLAVAGSIAAVGTYWLGAKILKPYSLSSAVGAKVALVQKRIERCEDETAALEQEFAYLKTEEGREALARRMSYHREGEKVYLLREDPPAP